MNLVLYGKLKFGLKDCKILINALIFSLE